MESGFLEKKINKQFHTITGGIDMNKVTFKEKHGSELFTVYSTIGKSHLETLYMMWYHRVNMNAFDGSFGDYVRMKHPDCVLVSEEELNETCVIVG